MYNERVVRKPRKQYVCTICHGKIDAEHVYIAVVVDGDFFAVRRHSSCHLTIQRICGQCNSNDCCTFDPADCYAEAVVDAKAFGTGLLNLENLSTTER